MHNSVHIWTAVIWDGRRTGERILLGAFVVCTENSNTKTGHEGDSEKGLPVAFAHKHKGFLITAFSALV